MVIDLDYGDYTGDRLARRITDILKKETPVQVNVTYSPDGRLVFRCCIPGCRVFVPGHPGDDPNRFVEEGDVVDDRWMLNLSTSSVNDMINRGQSQLRPLAEFTTKQINLDHHCAVFLHSSAIGTDLGPIGPWSDHIPAVRQDAPDGRVRMCCSGDFQPIPREGRMDFRLLDGKARGVAVGPWALLELELIRPSRLTTLRETARAWTVALPERLTMIWRGMLSATATICPSPCR